MYNKNQFKNEIESKQKDLYKILQILSESKIFLNIYAIGGTAMVLAGIKSSTKDIDFLTSNSQEDIRKILFESDLKEIQKSKGCNIWKLKELRIDFFYSGFILGTDLLEDWEEQSMQIYEMGNVKLSILNWYDVIITKIARSEERDLEDILLILKKENLDFYTLEDRYNKTVEISMIAYAEEKFKHLREKWSQQN